MSVPPPKPGNYHRDWLYTQGRHNWVADPQEVAFFHKGQHGRVSGYRGHVPQKTQGKNAGASNGEYSHWERSRRKHESKNVAKGVYGRAVESAKESGFRHHGQNPYPHGKSQYEMEFNHRESIPVPVIHKYIYEPNGEYLEEAFQKLTREAQPERYEKGVTGSGIGSTGRGGGAGGKSVLQRLHENRQSGMTTEMYLAQPSTRPPTTLENQDKPILNESRTPLVIPRSKRQLYQSARISQYDGHVPELITSHGVISSDFANEEYDNRVPTPDLHKPHDERHFNKIHSHGYEIGPTPIGAHAWDEVEKTRRWTQSGRMQLARELKNRASVKTKPSMFDPIPQPAKKQQQQQQKSVRISNNPATSYKSSTAWGGGATKYQTLSFRQEYEPLSTEKDVIESQMVVLRDSHQEPLDFGATTASVDLYDNYELSVPVTYVH